MKTPVTPNMEVRAIAVQRIFSWSALPAVILFVGCAASKTQTVAQNSRVSAEPKQVATTNNAPATTSGAVVPAVAESDGEATPIPTSPPPATKTLERTGLTIPAATEAAPSKSAESPVTLTALAARATAFYQNTPNYSCRLTRQERIGGTLQPKEKMLVNARLKPRSVYYLWLGEVNSGRECIYVEGQNEGKIVTKGGKSDFGFVGRRVAVLPTSFLARSRSRYTILESNLDQLAVRFQVQVVRSSAGDASQGTLEYKGMERCQDYPKPCHHVVEQLPPKVNPGFPRGGVRDWYFEPDTGRVVLTKGVDERGELLEFYYFEHFFANDTLSDNDFNPDLLWPTRSASRSDSKSASAQATSVGPPK